MADFTSHYSDVEGTALQSVQIVSLPANGTLALSGTAVTAGQVIAAANLGNLTFQPAANFNGVTSFTWNGSDGLTFLRRVRDGRHYRGPAAVLGPYDFGTAGSPLAAGYTRVTETTTSAPPKATAGSPARSPAATAARARPWTATSTSPPTASSP